MIDNAKLSEFKEEISYLGEQMFLDARDEFSEKDFDNALKTYSWFQNEHHYADTYA